MNKKKQLRALLKRLQDLQARADEGGVDPDEIQDELKEVEAAIDALEGAVDDAAEAVTTAEETVDEAAGEDSADDADTAEERKSIAKTRRSIRQTLAKRSVEQGTNARSLAGMASARPVVPGASSKEYRSAFFKNLMGRDLNAQERAAFVHTTANTAAVLPTETLNEIWDLVTGQHSIMGDIRILQSGTTIEVIKHTEVQQGNATTVNENAANQDEKNIFAKVTLAGKDFSKHIDVSYALERMSVDAFEQYIVGEIAALMGEAMATDVVTTIITTGTDYGMAATQAITTAAAGKIAFKEIAKALGLLKRAGKVCIYGTRSTIYNYLVGMEDTTGRPIFQPSAQAGVEGVCIGCDVKVEDALTDGVLLIGDGSKFTYNMIQDIMIETDKDIKKHVTTYAGYARGQGALIDPLAFCTLTVASGT
ncbi:MAG: phage major capsid protein [Clostridia bacterium]|nr:phage major capsid protein [Clostridia bacterium]